MFAAEGAWTATTEMSKARRRAVATVVMDICTSIGGHNGSDTTGPPGGANGTTYGDVQIGNLILSSAALATLLHSRFGIKYVTPRWSPAMRLPMALCT